MRLRQRIYKTGQTDGERWDAYIHRPDDIFICTPAKCGTTWTQTIVASLLFPDGNFPGAVMRIGPWFDGPIYDFDEVLSTLEAQTHRRQIKTHTSADGIPIFDTASYIVVGRDGRDAFMSWENHVAHVTPATIAKRNAIAIGQGRDPAPDYNGDIHALFEQWITDGSLMNHIATWWELRGQPNILFVHYNDLKANLNEEMRRIADFLKIEIAPELWPAMVARCTFDRMRADADKVGDFIHFTDGAHTFLFKGTNGRWQGTLTEAELQRYQQRVDELLPPEAAHWLEYGSKVLGQRSGDHNVGVE